MPGTKNFKFLCTILLWHLFCIEFQAVSTFGEITEEGEENVEKRRLNGTTNSAQEHNHYHHHHHSSYNVIDDQHSHTLFSGEQGYQYLLPEQTVFDSPEESIASIVISTSPPKLTIKPSPVQQRISHTNTLRSRADEFRSLHPEACVSETFPFVASSFAPQLQVSTNKAPMYGRVETPLSTESANNIAEDVQEMSQPSTLLLQGTNVATNVAGSKS